MGTEMKTKVRNTAVWIAGVIALAEIGYFAKRWLTFGRPLKAPFRDALLDSFMPRFDVAERHQTHVDAPADITFDTACTLDLQDSQMSRLLFKGRELLMGAGADPKPRPSLQPRQMVELGWTILADESEQLVLGTVTQPWRSNVRFEAIPKDEFLSFEHPGYAKIIFSLATVPIGTTQCDFRTETRVVTTDANAKKRFRLYWAFVSPGILLIRHEILRIVKRNAEQRYAFDLVLKRLA
jgi:hypothetical protein